MTDTKKMGNDPTLPAGPDHFSARAQLDDKRDEQHDGGGGGGGKKGPIVVGLAAFLVTLLAL
ncbi:MAG TPA: hypothetical protein VGH87_29690, partial [Polyangiaceae bacterium]